MLVKAGSVTKASSEWREKGIIARPLSLASHHHPASAFPGPSALSLSPLPRLSAGKKKEKTWLRAGMCVAQCGVTNPPRQGLLNHREADRRRNGREGDAGLLAAR